MESIQGSLGDPKVPENIADKQHNKRSNNPFFGKARGIFWTLHLITPSPAFPELGEVSMRALRRALREALEQAKGKKVPQFNNAIFAGYTSGRLR